MTQPKELHKDYRPKTFDDILGNASTVKMIKSKLKLKNYE